MELIVKTTGITNWFTIIVSPPERCCTSVTIGTDEASSSAQTSLKY